MRIKLRKVTKSEEEQLRRNADALEEFEPATPEERIKQAKIMGCIDAVLVFGFFLMIAYSIYENSKTIAVEG